MHHHCSSNLQQLLVVHQQRLDTNSMFGDDSKLRMRRNTSEHVFSNSLPFASPPSHRPSTNSTPTVIPPSMSSGTVKGKRKLRRNRQMLGKWAKTCLSGMMAAAVSATLSFLLLPLSWVQVDYHHQVQQAATHLWQRVEENRHNFATAIRGKHSPRQRKVLCIDGTVGFENDDYCDCPDGKDEPHTSACSHLHVQQRMFTCKNDRHKVIYSSRVGDGVWDCDDGSDEL